MLGYSIPTYNSFHWLMKECRILEFAKVMTSLCVDQLGMKIDIEGLSSPMKISDAVLDDILCGQSDLFHENFVQKIGRFIRRFYRMWKFRSFGCIFKPIS